MSHYLYHTKALILNRRELGEADLWLELFSESFGRVGALASGVRKPEAKLRYHLYGSWRGEFSLVAGKNFWRITGIEATHLPVNLKFSLAKARAATRALGWLSRLAVAEEKHSSLFEELSGGFDFLSQEELSRLELGDWESLLLARMIFHLGYGRRTISPWFAEEGFTWGRQLIEEFAPCRREVAAIIDEAIFHSHL